ETPISMYFKMDGDGIYAYHSMNRFEDRSLFGGLSVRINRHVWQEVSRILQSETDSSVYLINDQGELLSGSSPTAPTDEFLRQWKDGQPLSTELTVQRTANH